MDDLFHDAAGGGDRDGETDAQRAAGTRVDGSVDADQVSLCVNERTAGIPRIDGSIRLDEIFEGVDAQV